MSFQVCFCFFFCFFCFFLCFFFFSCGGHLDQWSGTISAILVMANSRKLFSVIFFNRAISL